MRSTTVYSGSSDTCTYSNIKIVFTQSEYLFFYSIGIFVLFNLFIVYKEEPRLKKDFKQGYETYCKMARRWI